MVDDVSGGVFDLVGGGRGGGVSNQGPLQSLRFACSPSTAASSNSLTIFCQFFSLCMPRNIPILQVGTRDI